MPHRYGVAAPSRDAGDVQPQVSAVAVVRCWPNRRLNRGQPFAGELSECLLGGFDVASGVHRGDDFAECPLRLSLSPVAAVPPLATLASNRVAVEVDNDGVTFAAFDDAASHD
jgi:hypothetical protein